MRDVCFFFNDTATTEIYTLSLHDALPISTETPFNSIGSGGRRARSSASVSSTSRVADESGTVERTRSEEHTSELQSRQYLVCRLLLEKKNRLSSHLLPLLDVILRYALCSS